MAMPAPAGRCFLAPIPHRGIGIFSADPAMRGQRYGVGSSTVFPREDSQVGESVAPDMGEGGPRP